MGGSARRVDLLGTLPLYPAFLERPVDPSPYLPVSRLAYNEIFVDPMALPEFAACTQAAAARRSARPRDAVAALARRPLVAYEEVARLTRRARADGPCCGCAGSRSARRA